jgi:hypothetical protein
MEYSYHYYTLFLLCSCRNFDTEHGLNYRHKLHRKPNSSFEDTVAQFSRARSTGDIEPLLSVTCSTGQSSNSFRMKHQRHSLPGVASAELFGGNNLQRKPHRSFADTGAQVSRARSTGEIEPFCSFTSSSGQSSTSARMKPPRDSFRRVASAEVVRRNREAERGPHNKEEGDGDVIPEHTLPKRLRGKHSETLIINPLPARTTTVVSQVSVSESKHEQLPKVECSHHRLV